MHTPIPSTYKVDLHNNSCVTCVCFQDSTRSFENERTMSISWIAASRKIYEYSINHHLFCYMVNWSYSRPRRSPSLCAKLTFFQFFISSVIFIMRPLNTHSKWITKCNLDDQRKHSFTCKIWRASAVFHSGLTLLQYGTSFICVQYWIIDSCSLSYSIAL
jgi:hypothetical protein